MSFVWSRSRSSLASARQDLGHYKAIPKMPFPLGSKGGLFKALIRKNSLKKTLSLAIGHRKSE